MTTDFFGCLHTEEVRGQKVRVLTLFSKKNIYLRMHRRTRTYFRREPALSRLSLRREGACRNTTKIAHTQALVQKNAIVNF